MAQKDPGKIFEECIALSCPERILVKKLADNASSWSGGGNTRFASKNECDFIMHDEDTGTFYGLELKSTKGASFTFWREDFELDGKKRTYMIKKGQILGLKKWSEIHKGVFGFLLNFRTKGNATFFVPIQAFLSYTGELPKKRIDVSDVRAMGGIEIASRKLKVNYRYDMESFFTRMSQASN